MTNEILKDEILSDEELDAVAGGGIFDWVGDKIIKPVVNEIVDVAETVVDTISDVTTGVNNLLKK